MEEKGWLVVNLLLVMKLVVDKSVFVIRLLELDQTNKFKFPYDMVLN